jgi:hypothetical protein
LRQAYGYWQDQPGSIRREADAEASATQLQMLKQSFNT